MKRNRAAYMRAYRASQAKSKTEPRPAGLADLDRADAAGRIAELEEEIRHLKAELAKRPTERTPISEMASMGAVKGTPHQFNSRPFTPVPKSGKS